MTTQIPCILPAIYEAYFDCVRIAGVDSFSTATYTLLSSVQWHVRVTICADSSFKAQREGLNLTVIRSFIAPWEKN